MPKKTSEPQEKVNRFYQEMDELVITSLEQAKASNKRLLINVVDFHLAYRYPQRFKNILLTQTVLLDICKHRKISNYFTEGTEADRKNFETMHCYVGPFTQDHTCVVNKVAKDYGFKFISLEKQNAVPVTKQPKFLTREQNMVEAILQSQNDGIYIGGFLHFKALHENEELNDKFIILSVNGVPEVDRFVELTPDDIAISGLTAEELRTRLSFILDPKKVIQKVVIDNLQDRMDASEVLSMLSKASEWFRTQPSSGFNPQINNFASPVKNNIPTSVPHLLPPPEGPALIAAKSVTGAIYDNPVIGILTVGIALFGIFKCMESCRKKANEGEHSEREEDKILNKVAPHGARYRKKLHR